MLLMQCCGLVRAMSALVKMPRSGKCRRAQAHIQRLELRVVLNGRMDELTELASLIRTMGSGLAFARSPSATRLAQRVFGSTALFRAFELMDVVKFFDCQSKASERNFST